MWMDCRHLGEIVEMRKANLCGLKGREYPVFASALHGTCISTQFCKKQPEKMCFLCDDAEASPRE